jgi:hypothetical protein
MNFLFDIKGYYGLKANDFKDVPDVSGKHAQVSKTSHSLWKQTGNKWEFMPVTLAGIALWNPKMRITARKVMVETPMVERDGSVKEMIALDDYIINIRGVIKAQSQYPIDELEELAKMWKNKAVLPIESAKTAIFLSGQENVVITNMTLPEVNGKTESQEYEIECVSDIAFELELE